jgi:putative ABC transport system permease protein
LKSAKNGKMIVWRGMRISVVAVGIGPAGAFMLTRFMASFLYGVTARDPVVFVTVPVILIVAALGAAWLPARMITRLDVTSALRCE